MSIYPPLKSVCPSIRDYLIFLCPFQVLELMKEVTEEEDEEETISDISGKQSLEEWQEKDQLFNVVKVV